jgi:hypothetical protein
LLEPANARDSKFERMGADPAQCIGKIGGDRPVDLADEAKREVQLFFVLPAKIGGIVHGIDEEVPDWAGRPYGYEKPVHLP